MAIVNHTFVEQTTEQTHTGDALFTDITGAEITSGNFIAGKKYLIITNAQVGGDSSSDSFDLQTLHGSTAFAESRYSMEPNHTASNEYMRSYTWFTVWTAVTSEGIKMQFQTSNSSQTVKVDQVKKAALSTKETLLAQKKEIDAGLVNLDARLCQEIGFPLSSQLEAEARFLMLIL